MLQDIERQIETFDIRQHCQQNTVSPTRALTATVVDRPAVVLLQKGGDRQVYATTRRPRVYVRRRLTINTVSKWGCAPKTAQRHRIHFRSRLPNPTLTQIRPERNNIARQHRRLFLFFLTNTRKLIIQIINRR